MEKYRNTIIITNVKNFKREKHKNEKYIRKIADSGNENTIPIIFGLGLHY